MVKLKKESKGFTDIQKIVIVNIVLLIVVIIIGVTSWALEKKITKKWLKSYRDKREVKTMTKSELEMRFIETALIGEYVWNSKHYCLDCQRECSTIPVDECHPSEAWGTTLSIPETYLMCEQCGSYEITENIEEEVM